MLCIMINVNYVKVNNVVQAPGLRSSVPTLIQEFVNDACMTLCKEIKVCYVLDICILASLLLKQIFMHDVGYDVPTFRYGSMCPVYVP